jgi:CRP-like cAMP-binding protein
MTDRVVSTYLQQALQEVSERVQRKRGTVLFRRGDEAAGMYIVVRGRVVLDLGVDSVSGSSCGPGALVGLPSTLTGKNYGMTATVSEDACLSFIPLSALRSLLKHRPDLCRVLLAMLGKIIADNKDQQQRLFNGDQYTISHTG